MKPERLKRPYDPIEVRGGGGVCAELSKIFIWRLDFER